MYVYIRKKPGFMDKKGKEGEVYGDEKKIRKKKKKGRINKKVV